MPKVTLQPNLYAGIDKTKSHHKIGTIQFVPIDGEGINESPIKCTKQCVKCNQSINGTKISTSLTEFYHPRCYYAK
jgi:hypothetical protein